MKGWLRAEDHSGVCPMKPIEVAIDDYLHVIVRTRPWTKKREEAVLEEFTDWLYAQPTPRTRLDEITPELIQPFSAAITSGDQRRELMNILNTLYRWALHQEWVVANPFEPVSA
jgi:hypothetical protein